MKYWESEREKRKKKIGIKKVKVVKNVRRVRRIGWIIESLPSFLIVSQLLHFIYKMIWEVRGERWPLRDCTMVRLSHGQVTFKKSCAYWDGWRWRRNGWKLQDEREWGPMCQLLVISVQQSKFPTYHQYLIRRSVRKWIHKNVDSA